MTNVRVLYRSLMKVDNLAGLSNQRSLYHLAHLIDVSLDVGEVEGIEKAIALSAELQKRKLTPRQSATLYYFLANAWSNFGGLTRARTDKSWTWEEDESEHEITYLRQAIQYDGFLKLPKYRRCQILTNLGNLLHRVGRFVEGIDYWDMALKTDHSFAMARANRGRGIYEYAYAMNSRHDAVRFIRVANAELKAALRSARIHRQAREYFTKYQIVTESIERQDKAAKHRFNESGSLGSTKSESAYRTWCLGNRLFLNHLNDLGTDPNAARDNILLPPIRIPINDGFHYEGIFNALKQEFVSARFLYFEGSQSQRVHFSDRSVLLYNTLDYPSYSLAVEKIKAAFRVAYSLFDKSAYFLNDYLGLSIEQRQVYFRSFWYISRDKSRGLRDEFVNRKNWPLRGLFWLSKDLFEDNPGFRQAIEPDAQELYEIRNQIEHKYLKVHEFGRPRVYDDDTSFLADRLAFSVDRKELEAKTLKVLKMARAALIYLCLAINWEERERAKALAPNVRVLSMPMDTIRDEWKF